LKYRPGDSIVIAHGAGDVSFSLHEHHPFKVAGILARTGTPVDRTVHVSLAGLDAVHEGTGEGSAADPLSVIVRTERHSAENIPSTPRAITAFLVGLKSRSTALSMQRWVNEYSGEPLTAALPGVALQEVWEITSAVEKTLFAVSALVVVVGLAASFAGNILLSRIGAIQADTARGLEFEVIAGVVIGGTSLYGGQGNILRTIIGVVEDVQERGYDLWMKPGFYIPTTQEVYPPSDSDYLAVRTKGLGLSFLVRLPRPRYF
jgi:hypothetical protein